MILAILGIADAVEQLFQPLSQNLEHSVPACSFAPHAMFAMKELHNMVVSACCAVPTRLEQHMSTMTASVGHKGARREILRVCHVALGFFA